MSNPRTLRVAAVQMTSLANPAENLQTADALTRSAIARGADVVVLPESWTVLGTPEQLRAGAQSLDGDAIGWAREIAREHGIDIIAGSLTERLAEGERHANTSVHVAPDGTIRAIYRKIHLFDVSVDDTSYKESDVVQPGEEVVCTELQDGTTVGMGICYDLRFPELFRRHASAGARILVLPSAFTLGTTRDHWEVLLRARAIENQCFVIAPNQVGLHPDGHRSGGRSMIIDPWGIVLAQAADEEQHISAELNFARQDHIRDQLPALRNRRLADHS